MSKDKLTTQQSLIKPTCPNFSEILTKTAFSFPVGSIVHQIIRLTPTPATQFFRIITSALNLLAIAFLVVLALYLPEYVFDYSSRNDAFQRFFGYYILIMVLIILLIGVIKVMISPSICYIDVDGKKMIFARTLNETTYQQKSVDFRDVSSIELVPTIGMFGTNKVLVLVNDDYYIVTESKKRSDELEQLTDWLKAITKSDNG